MCPHGPVVHFILDYEATIDPIMGPSGIAPCHQCLLEGLVGHLYATLCDRLSSFAFDHMNVRKLLVYEFYTMS
jgi:hypothetical protein